MRVNGRIRRDGMTLVEVLTATAVVALLIGLLVPGLSSAREAARSAVCASNLRQMSLAATAYAMEGEERYPLAQWFEIGEGGSVSTAWDFTTEVVWGEGMTVKPGLLWGYLDDGAAEGALGVQQCPSFDGAANWLADPHTGYNYNTSYIGRGRGETQETPARLAEVGSPSATALFGDGGWAGGANKFMRSPIASAFDAGFSNSSRYAGTQAYRHSGGTMVAWCDGAVVRRVERWDEMAQVVDGTGFLGEENELYDLD